MGSISPDCALLCGLSRWMEGWIGHAKEVYSVVPLDFIFGSITCHPLFLLFRDADERQIILILSLQNE